MRVFLFLFMCLVSLLSIAQGLDTLKSTSPDTSLNSKIVKPDPKIRYKALSISIPYKKVRDEGHSPLTHRGPSIQLATFNERWRSKKGVTRSITKFEMVLGIGLIRTNKNKVSSITQASTLYMDINYQYMRPIKKLFNGKGEWFLGALVTNTFDGRYYTFLPNNSFGYEFSNVINPATEFTYKFSFGKIDRNYQIGFKLNTALLAHVVRPNFIGMEPAETYMDENIKPLAILTNGNKIVLPNRFFRINTEIYLDRFKKSNNDKFRFYYGWGLHVTRLPSSNPLYVATHTIGFVRMLYSKKEKIKKIN